MHDPSSPPPLRPRLAWTPPSPPPPPPPVRITEPAVLAYPGGQIPPELTLPCGGCHRVHVRGAASSFPILHAEAEHAGWRRDLYGVWACPACQLKPGWRGDRAPALVWGAEHALIRDVAAQAAPRWRWRRAFREARVWRDAKALRALRP